LDTFALLDQIVYSFRGLFGSQNFALFYAYVWGVILCGGRHTVSGIYQAERSQTRYWSLVKFLSRGRWEIERVVWHLIELILSYVSDRVYVYDQTHTIKTGKKQHGLHFFHNHRYRKGNTNQSKFHWGHQFAGLGILTITASAAYLFPVWVKLLAPEALAASGFCAFTSIVRMLPAGLIIFDRGFNNRKYFRCLLENGHHLLCRARKNAAFYYPAAPPKRPRKGRKKTYGKRICVKKWRYENLYIKPLGKTVSVAHKIVLTKICPRPVRLVVVRTRPKKNKPYRYFLAYTTDLTLSVETIIYYYKLRWSFETGIRDSKESFGFDHYQVRSKQAIERSVFLSFLSASLVQLIALPNFQKAHSQTLPSLRMGLGELNIHWYHPKHWTKGLIVLYIRWKKGQQLFSASSSSEQTQTKKKIPYSIAAD